MLQYLSKASLYKLNDGLGREYRRSQSTLADRIKIQDSDSVRLIDQFPNLENELNDANSSVPAYVRFQR